MFHGLSELSLDRDEEEYLLRPFDEMMNIPKVDRMENPCFFFTEHGKEEFKDGIEAIKNVFEQDGLFEVCEIVVEKDDLYAEDILYEDDYQVALKEGTFERN